MSRWTNSLLRRFPGETASALRGMASHLRASYWSVDAGRCMMQVRDFQIVVDNQNEEQVLCVDALEANWSSYRKPILDVSLTNATISLHIDEVVAFRRPTTNWQRLRRTPFPPKIIEYTLIRPSSSFVSLSSLSSPWAPSPPREPRFRSLQCHGQVIVEISATVFGHCVRPAGINGTNGSGLPRVILEGSTISALWEHVLTEWREGRKNTDISEDEAEGLTVDEFTSALARIFARLLLENLDDRRRERMGGIQTPHFHLMKGNQSSNLTSNATDEEDIEHNRPFVNVVSNGFDALESTLRRILKDAIDGLLQDPSK